MEKIYYSTCVKQTREGPKTYTIKKRYTPTNGKRGPKSKNIDESLKAEIIEFAETHSIKETCDHFNLSYYFIKKIVS